MELTEYQKRIHEYMEYLKSKESEHVKALDAVRKNMEYTKKLCNHSFQLIGNNHNDDIEECIICGHRIYV